MEKEWNSIPDELKKRILSVDKVILYNYASKFNYSLYKQFIAVLKKHF